MTKFCLASDVHLEFGSLVLNNDRHADCLILAGDIVPFCDLTPKGDLIHNWVDEFFKNISDEFPLVIWVPGNHEWYGSTMPIGINRARQYIEAMGLGNIKIIDRESILVEDTWVHGATLWTDYGRGSPINMETARNSMNDYNQIQRRYKDIDIMIRPEFLYEEHLLSVEFIKSAVSDGQKSVVVTHHAPLLQAAYDGLWHCYASDLSNLILDNPCIKYWVYGHTHTRDTYHVGDTKVVSNCRGYVKYEPMAKTFTPLYFEC